jgi:hypothetical protein
MRKISKLKADVLESFLTETLGVGKEVSRKDACLWKSSNTLPGQIGVLRLVTAFNAPHAFIFRLGYCRRLYSLFNGGGKHSAGKSFFKMDVPNCWILPGSRPFDGDNRLPYRKIDFLRECLYAV